MRLTLPLQQSSICKFLDKGVFRAKVTVHFQSGYLLKPVERSRITVRPLLCSESLFAVPCYKKSFEVPFYKVAINSKSRAYLKL